MYLVRQDPVPGDVQRCDLRFNRSCLYTPSWLVLGSRTDSPPSLEDSKREVLKRSFLRMAAYRRGLDFRFCRIAIQELSYLNGTSWTDSDKPIPFGDFKLKMVGRTLFCKSSACDKSSRLPEIFDDNGNSHNVFLHVGQDFAASKACPIIMSNGYLSDASLMNLIALEIFNGNNHLYVI